jgi:hypothetical protein
MKSGNLNFLEPSGPLQACNRTAVPLPFFTALSTSFSWSITVPSNLNIHTHLPLSDTEILKVYLHNKHTHTHIHTRANERHKPCNEPYPNQIPKLETHKYTDTSSQANLVHVLFHIYWIQNRELISRWGSGISRIAMAVNCTNSTTEHEEPTNTHDNHLVNA